MAPIDDASFSTGTGLECVGVVGLDQDCWWVELEDAGSSGWSVFGLLGRSWADTGLVCRPCVVEPGVGLLLRLNGRLWMWHSSARRTRKKKGRRGLCPWPLRCLSQILSKRKERILRLLSIGLPFIDELSMYL